MYSLIANLDVQTDGMRRAMFLVDVDEDITLVPTNDLLAGSIIIIADGHKKLILNHEGSWT